jgi:radical SAM superfamily enzyme YgiQ (UPF0313 family)
MLVSVLWRAAFYSQWEINIMNVLIISFDMVREGECPTSYSIASLLASLKTNLERNINIECWSFNILENNFKQKLQDKIESNNLNKFEKIAISVFVWSELIVKELLKNIKFVNYRGAIILGGKQIVGEKKELKNDYPRCKIFVIGYGESCINEAINSNTDMPIFLYGSCENMNIPSPYLINEFIIVKNQKMVRMETKRGCPYSCSFCAHKDLNDNKIYDFSYDRIKNELDLFKSKQVKKINIIDPIFNIGDNYLEILEYIHSNKIKSQISIQVRFEQIKGEKGMQFIGMCSSSKMDIVLEFGIQSIIEKECKVLARENDINNIEKIVKILNERRIKYEISLIYGLPEQTVITFQKTIEYLRSIGCRNIKFYPLMLLKGTKLYKDKEKWGLKEKIFENNIPIVVESNSFSETEWKKMKQIAEQS